MARPFVKWTGGKRSLLPDLEKVIGEVCKGKDCKGKDCKGQAIQAYHEPFIGGGALFFHLATEGLLRDALLTNQIHLADANTRLMRTYRAIQRDVEGVVKELQGHARCHSKDHFHVVRGFEGIDLEEDTVVAGWFIYINKTGFNGLYRVNRSGRCNTPWGKKERFTPDEEGLRECAAALQGVNLGVCDFAHGAKRSISVPSDDKGSTSDPLTLWYADPPYLAGPDDKSGFVSFNNKGWTWSDVGRLRGLADELVQEGVVVIVNQPDTPAVRELWTGWTMLEVQARRSVSRDGAGRGKTGELILVGAGEKGDAKGGAKGGAQ